MTAPDPVQPAGERVSTEELVRRYEGASYDSLERHADALVTRCTELQAELDRERAKSASDRATLGDLRSQDFHNAVIATENSAELRKQLAKVRAELDAIRAAGSDEAIEFAITYLTADVAICAPGYDAPEAKILRTITALAAKVEEHRAGSLICTGCGRIGAPPPKPFISCCPERHPVSLASEEGAETLLMFADLRKASTPRSAP